MLHVLTSVSALKSSDELYKKLTKAVPRPNLKEPANFCQWLRSKLIKEIDPMPYEEHQNILPLEIIVRIRRSLILNQFHWPFV